MPSRKLTERPAHDCFTCIAHPHIDIYNIPIIGPYSAHADRYGDELQLAGHT